ncbi:MAG: EAL domain-containing protein [Acidobacteriota bacterium]|nr:EAL domain-containing protein [Acidobacteriota bacterium]
MVILPPAPTPTGAEGGSRGRRFLVWTVLVCGLLASTACGWGWARVQAANYRSDRADVTSSITSSVTSAFQRELDFEAAFAQEIATEPDLTNRRLAPWLEGLQLGRRYPGTLGMALVEPVASSALPGFVQTIRADPLVGEHADDFALYSSGTPSQYCLARLGIVLSPGLPAGVDFCTSQLPALGASLLPPALVEAKATGRAQLADIVTPTGAAHLREAGVPAATATSVMAIFIVVEPVYAHDDAGAPGGGAFVGWVVGTFSSSGLAGVPVRSVRGAEVAVGTLSGGRFTPMGSAGPRLPGGRYASVSATATQPALAVRTTVGAENTSVPQGVVVGVFGALLTALLFALLYRLVWSRDRARAEAVHAEHSLAVSEERFKTLATTAPIDILETTRDGAVSYANPKAAEITGRPIEALLGFGWLGALHEREAPGVLALLETIPDGRKWVTTHCRVFHADGGKRYVRMLMAPKGDGADAGQVITLEDITDETRAHRELERQAFHDPLTGLPNRALFLDRLEQEIAASGRGGRRIAVLFMDLDGFKRVNDGLGHDVGDAVLEVMGRRLRKVVRAGETVARLGGDEFMFIIRDVDGAEDAERAAGRILEVVQEPVPLGGRDLALTGSIGIVVACEGADAATVLRDADTAMYKAKQAGRNRYEVFDETLHRRSVARLEIETELRHALERGELDLYYQPLVEAATGRPLACEALVRWHHPTRGLVPPDEFVPVAEEAGLVVPLGQWVFERAVRQLGAWDLDPHAPKLASLAVNVSARQLDDPRTTELLDDLLRAAGVASERFVVEVTETVLMADGESTARSLAALRKMGVRVAIDDFGTGYSSLAYLHSLPVTTVKIDRSFTGRLGGDEDSTPVVKAIIDMSHALGLQVVAEGVADGRLAALVAGLGCDLAQGFHFGRPLPPEEFEAWWHEASRRTSGLAALRVG